MQVQVNIAFEQLLKVVRKLPPGQLKLLKAEIDGQGKKTRIDFEALLLNGPTATQKQLDTIDSNRASINNWGIR